ncbi:MAG: RND family efflux transporter MFP subunit [Akkermansiaceae bacterium]|jgi:RND family efflux transporter MFP subunit
MSLDDLIKKSSDSSSAGTPYSKRKRSFAWLLPVGLLLGFLIILGLLFGGRLLPATSVKTAPVITIRAGESLSLRGGGNSLVNDTKPSGKGSLLFQASGWVEPDPYTVFVPTLINGVVDEVHALEGQSIKKGDLVATLVDDEARLDFQSAQQKYTSLEKKIVAHCTGFEVVRAEISAAQRKIEAFETRLDEARDTSSRLSKLSKGTVSQQQVVQARLATERQIAMLAEAKTEIPRLEALFTQLEAEEEAMTANLDELATARERAKLALDRTKITSSMDGIVLQLHAAPGMKRMLDMDSPTSAVIVELYDPKHLQARIDVPLNEAAALSAGQAVELVSDLLPNKTFTGTVTRISGQADLQRNTLQAKIEIKEPDERLRPDMLVRAKFFSSGNAQSSGEKPTASSGRLALYVSEKALVSETQVWIVTPGFLAEKRSIKLGNDTKDGHRLVLEGLRSGESVILPPHAKLEEGSRVEITNPNH